MQHENKEETTLTHYITLVCEILTSNHYGGHQSPGNRKRIWKAGTFTLYHMPKSIAQPHSRSKHNVHIMITASGKWRRIPSCLSDNEKTLYSRRRWSGQSSPTEPSIPLDLFFFLWTANFSRFLMLTKRQTESTVQYYVRVPVVNVMAWMGNTQAHAYRDWYWFFCDKCPIL